MKANLYQDGCESRWSRVRTSRRNDGKCQSIGYDPTQKGQGSRYIFGEARLLSLSEPSSHEAFLTEISTLMHHSQRLTMIEKIIGETMTSSLGSPRDPATLVPTALNSDKPVDARRYRALWSTGENSRHVELEKTTLMLRLHEVCNELCNELYLRFS